MIRKARVMSIKLMSWVFEHSESVSGERLVLLAIADSANDEGVCWPSYETIAKKANVSRRYVMDVIKKLEEVGIIKVSHRYKDGLNTSNVYQMVIPTVVIPSSLPLDSELPSSEPQITRVVNPRSLGSDPQITRVVNPSSPKSLINHQLTINEPLSTPLEKENPESPEAKQFRSGSIAWNHFKLNMGATDTWWTRTAKNPEYVGVEAGEDKPLIRVAVRDPEIKAHLENLINIYKNRMPDGYEGVRLEIQGGQS
jgi:hypothetical protein